MVAERIVHLMCGNAVYHGLDTRCGEKTKSLEEMTGRQNDVTCVGCRKKMAEDIAEQIAEARRQGTLPPESVCSIECGPMMARIWTKEAHGFFCGKPYKIFEILVNNEFPPGFAIGRGRDNEVVGWWDHEGWHTGMEKSPLTPSP